LSYREPIQIQDNLPDGDAAADGAV
jgi:hypothetical protein